MYKTTLIDINKSKWSVYDPDNILDYDRSNFDLSILKFSGDIRPREGLLQFEHQDTSHIIDFGFYGDEVKFEGVWVVYVINGMLKEDAWEHPLERIESKNFLDGIENVQLMFNKYT